MKDETFKWAGITGATLAAWWAKVPHPEQALLILILLDLAMEFLGSRSQDKFTRQAMVKRISLKCRTLVYLAGAGIVDHYFSTDIGFDVHKPVAYMLCFYEFTSITDNYTKYGGKVPAVAKAALDKLGSIFNGKPETAETAAAIKEATAKEPPPAT